MPPVSMRVRVAGLAQKGSHRCNVDVDRLRKPAALALYSKPSAITSASRLARLCPFRPAAIGQDVRFHRNKGAPHFAFGTKPVPVPSLSLGIFISFVLWNEAATFRAAPRTARFKQACSATYTRVKRIAIRKFTVGSNTDGNSYMCAIRHTYRLGFFNLQNGKFPRRSPCEKRLATFDRKKGTHDHAFQHVPNWRNWRLFSSGFVKRMSYRPVSSAYPIRYFCVADSQTIINID